MAATADREIQRQPSELVAFTGVSGQTYYAGTMVMRGVSHLLPAARGTTDSRFVGVIENRVDLSGGNVGASNHEMLVHMKGEFTFDAQGTGSTDDIGKVAYIIDDETVGTSVAPPYNEAGIIVGLPSTSEYRVRITNSVAKDATNS